MFQNNSVAVTRTVSVPRDFSLFSPLDYCFEENQVKHLQLCYKTGHTRYNSSRIAACNPLNFRAGSQRQINFSGYQPTFFVLKIQQWVICLPLSELSLTRPSSSKRGFLRSSSCFCTETYYTFSRY